MSKTHAHLMMGAALLSLAAVPLSFDKAEAADPGAPVLLDVHTIKPGTKGYGLTVFSGTQPERFDVEVIGTLHNFLPQQDLVLIKTHHPRLEVAKVVAGMSGSPIFIDGKMIGAYAYGWQFGEEAVAGVTPIKSMIEELQRPIPAELLRPLTPLPMQGGQPAPRVGALSASGMRFAGAPLDYKLGDHAQQVASSAFPRRGDSAGINPVPVATPIMIGGVRESSLNMLQQALAPLGLEPLQGGGGASQPDPNAPTRFVDGGAIGVQLVRGDVSATGIGTVTRVSGNRWLAFGHPMMNAGISRLPTAVAKVQWVLASKMRSFKMGEPVRPLGALINDRQAAIVGDSTVDAPTFPVRLNIIGVDGAPHPNWSMEVAHERFMAPMFVAVAIGNAVDATTQERRDVSWHAYTTVRVKGRGAITMHDFGVAVGGTPGAGEFMDTRAVRAIGALLSNPWEPVQIESVETRLDVRFARDVLWLRGVEPLETEIDAGQKAHIRLHLVPYAGPEQTRVIEVNIPQELSGSNVEITLTPGHQESPELAPPENVSELMAVLPQRSFAPDVLVASVNVGGHGVAYHGQVATHLPPGALNTLHSEVSTVGPVSVASVARTIIPMHQFVVGTDVVRVRVRDVLR